MTATSSINLQELQGILEPMIQQIVHNELKKLAYIPDNVQKMEQTQWQAFIQETSGSWQDIPLAEEIREGWDSFSKRELC